MAVRVGLEETTRLGFGPGTPAIQDFRPARRWAPNGCFRFGQPLRSPPSTICYHKLGHPGLFCCDLNGPIPSPIIVLRICTLILLTAILLPAASAQTSNNPAGPSASQPETPAGVPETATKKSQVPPSKQQPKRILGMMPNYRAVSAGEIPPPPTPKQAFKIATQNSFDYSSFVFVRITSLLAEGTNAHRDLGKGVEGFGNYYWRGFVDKADGNYLVIFAYPTIFHEDERYFTMGQGGFLKRTTYAASRVLITPSYSGHDGPNLSELFGRATAQGISTTYYPKADRTIGALASRFGWALGRDALTNVFREWWPDIAVHVLHRQP